MQHILLQAVGRNFSISIGISVLISYRSSGPAARDLGPQRRKPTVGREDIGAEEGKEQFCAIVVGWDRENQRATECLRARDFDRDSTFEHHTGLRHVRRRIMTPDLA